MKRLFLVILLSFCLISSQADAKLWRYTATSLTGGGTAALDKINGDNLQEGDSALVTTSTGHYVYYLDADSNLTEDSPYVISPDTNPGTKRWVLVQDSSKYYARAGATDQGVDSNDFSLLDLMTTIGTAKRATIVFRHWPKTGSDTTTYTVTTALDMTSYPYIMLEFENGVLLAGSGAKTLYSPSNIIASPSQQIFSGSGTISFANMDSPGYAEWWGIDGTADQTEINKALVACKIVQLLGKTYTITGSIQMNTDNMLLGYRDLTVISANLAADNIIESTDSTVRTYRWTIKDIKIDNTSRDNAGAVGIAIINQKDFVIENVSVNNCETAFQAAAISYNGVFRKCLALTVDTGFLINQGTFGGSTYGANEITLEDCRVNDCEVGYDIDGVSNIYLNHSSAEVFEAGAKIGIRIANTVATLNTTIIAPRLENAVAAGSTGISIGALAQRTNISASYYVNLGTKLSDSSNLYTLQFYPRHHTENLWVEKIRFGDADTDSDTGVAILRATSAAILARNSTDSDYLDIRGETVSGFEAITQSNPTNGQYLIIKSNTTLHALSAAATSTWTNGIPAGGVMVIGVTARVTTEITGCTGFDIGDGVTADKFGDNVAVASGTTSKLSNGTATTPTIYPSVNNIVLTAVGGGGAFTGGVVRLTVHYIALSAPTS
jgi:hypothetical protein